VIAIDASASQIAHAAQHPNIEYRVGSAEHSGLHDHSIDLVTVATALHWFDLDAFYREVNRVLKPGGAIAVWGYGDPVMDDPRLHELVDTFNQTTLATYWPPERFHLVDGYRSLPFPFTEIEPHEWILEETWTLDDLLGYLSTWSGVQRYIDREHQNPLAALLPELANAWGDEGQRHRIRWPIRMRAGYRNE
jgi:SAM-dependent methyltransferase